MALNVVKCICHDRSFEEIKEYAEEQDLNTIEELREERFCSCGCRMCTPYVELVLETGETVFEPGAYYKRKDNSK